MPKSQVESSQKRAKNIKNIYILKINSLFKIMGDQSSELSCLNNSRRTVSAPDYQGWLLQKRQNNRGAARMARLRKKIYMELLEQTIQKLQKLNQQGKQLQKCSNQLLQSLGKQNEVKKEDEIGKYLIQEEAQKSKKEWSKATMDLQKQCKLIKIVSQIQKVSFPTSMNLRHLETTNKALWSTCQFSKIQELEYQLPQLFLQLKGICSDHALLHVKNQNQMDVDPYIYKTLMEEYYSKTICKKDVNSIQIHKYLENLSKIQSYCAQVQQIDS